ncbi:hypothetical protein DW049_11545 [Ruminococcus sp. AF41-9]|nr:hypothetical protein DW049_11545 [Ruminococcus sp. AF41-9]
MFTNDADLIELFILWECPFWDCKAEYRALSVLTACTLFLLNIRKILSLDMLAKVTHTEGK